tara:strand:+ start:13561 stop:14448 length:888 start_codon:yes stop_codon:yes gene_type:complete
MAPTLELNQAQSLLYSHSNIRRAFDDFESTDVAGIYRRSDHLLVVRNDGTQQSYPIHPIQLQFQSFTGRLKNFFSYLGPNYRGPSLWRHNAYVMFKGWSYCHVHGHQTTSAKLQAKWADKFVHLSRIEELQAALNYGEFQLGHIIAPYGFNYQNKDNSPWCSCGSFQTQLNNLKDFQDEIPEYQPNCIHLTWFQKYHEFLAKRTELRSLVSAPSKCVAWWYYPPVDSASDGRFMLLYTTSGAQAPLSHWHLYEPTKHFNSEHVWDLFFRMMEAGYVPFPGQSLPQLTNAFRKPNA